MPPPIKGTMRSGVSGTEWSSRNGVPETRPGLSEELAWEHTAPSATLQTGGNMGDAYR